MSERDPHDLFDSDTSLQGELRRTRKTVRSLSRRNVRGNTLEEFAPDGGAMGATYFGDTMVDPNGIHSSADLVDINWYLPLTLADDDVTVIYSVAERTISGVRYLYAGGQFNRIGGVAAINVARYNFTTRAWEAIDDGSLNGAVNSVALDASNNLYIGGSFTNASGVAAADYIALLSGAAWTSVGGGLNGFVQALAFDNSGVLHAGGNFTSAGGDALANYVAKYSGGAWSNVGAGLNGTCRCVAFDSSNYIYVGGSFTNYVKSNVGGSWAALGGGVNSHVRCIAFNSAGVCYIGGDFQDAGGDTAADYIAKLSGASWVSVGDGTLSATVWCIAFDSYDTLYIGGAFDNASSNANADKIAKLSIDNVWTTVSNAGGGQNVVYGMKVLTNGSIAICGSFSFMGSISCEGVTIFCKPLSESIDMIAALFELYSSRITARINAKVDKMILSVGAASFSPADSTTYHFGGVLSSAPTTNANLRLYVPLTGTITTVFVFWLATGVAGTSENVSVYLRKNADSLTDTLIETIGDTAAGKVFNNSALSFAVTAGENIEIIIVAPAWATNPTNVLLSGSVVLQQ